MKYFKQILWKNCFLPKWNIKLKWNKHIPKENHHNKSWFFFLWKSTGVIDVAWVVVINLSNKLSLSFKSEISFIYTLDSTFFTCLKFEASFWNSRSSRPEVFCKNSALTNFAKFTRKHLCQRLFFNFLLLMTHHEKTRLNALP